MKRTLEVAGLEALDAADTAAVNGGIYGPPPAPPPPWLRQMADYYLARHVAERQSRRPPLRPARGPF
ncbi:MAG: hypothetical protein ACAI25_01705 [Planctomycetota bacterium]